MSFRSGRHFARVAFSSAVPVAALVLQHPHDVGALDRRVLVDVVDGAAHVEQISVRPDHQWNGAYCAWPADAAHALIRLGRERQLTARELSGRVGEIVDGIGTIDQASWRYCFEAVKREFASEKVDTQDGIRLALANSSIQPG